jgi:hypothetical protein
MILGNQKWNGGIPDLINKASMRSTLMCLIVVIVLDMNTMDINRRMEPTTWTKKYFSGNEACSFI